MSRHPWLSVAICCVEVPWSWWQHASTRRSFLILGGLAATLLAAQGIVLFPLVVTDPQIAGLAEDVSLSHTFWILRLLTIAMAPMILALRAVSVSVLLQGAVALWGAEARWKDVLHGVLRAEFIFLAESACATLVLLWHAPSTLRGAESLTLRAGLDLFWQPASSHVAALLVAANLFALLWTLQIRTVLRQTTSVASMGANGLALLFGVLLVVIRTIAVVV